MTCFCLSCLIIGSDPMSDPSSDPMSGPISDFCVLHHISLCIIMKAWIMMMPATPKNQRNPKRRPVLDDSDALRRKPINDFGAVIFFPVKNNFGCYFPAREILFASIGVELVTLKISLFQVIWRPFTNDNHLHHPISEAIKDKREEPRRCEPGSWTEWDTGWGCKTWKGPPYEYKHSICYSSRTLIRQYIPTMMNLRATPDIRSSKMVINMGNLHIRVITSGK